MRAFARAIARDLAVMAIAAALTSAAACAPAAPASAPDQPGDADRAMDAVAEEWSQHEHEVLTALSAGDPTLALRFGGTPSLAGPDAEVEADWLAPAARAQGVADAEAALSRWGDTARIPRAKESRAKQWRLERELVIRAVREERFRVDHEAALPRAASDLARAMAVAMAAAPATDPQRAHERWIARRLEEIRASMKGASLDAAELAELEDALDPMERGASPATTAALVRVRLELEATPRAKERAPDPAFLEQSLGAHAGTSFPLAVVRSRLERAETALREGGIAYAPRLSADETRGAEKDAATKLFGPAAPPCGSEDNTSMRRAMPPPERAAACAEVQLAAAAASDRSTYVTLLTLHDHVTVALWAVARSEGAPPISGAEVGHRLLSAATPETRARLARLAAVRPTAAITAGLAAEMLARRGSDGVARVAKAWTAFGDAPLDVVEREVTTKLP